MGASLPPAAEGPLHHLQYRSRDRWRRFQNGRALGVVRAFDDPFVLLCGQGALQLIKAADFVVDQQYACFGTGHRGAGSGHL